MKALMERFLSDESGQGLTEYALIIAIVSIGVMVAMVAFRNEIRNVFGSATSAMQTAPVGETG